MVKVITPPSSVVDIDQLMLHLRVSDAGEQGLVESIAEAAREFCQHYTGRAIGSQAVEVGLDQFPCGAFELPLVATGLTSIKYDDENNVEQTLSGVDLNLYADVPYIFVADDAWPTSNGKPGSVRIRYVCGTVPNAVKHAMFLIAGHLYENREAAQDKPLATIPMGVNALLDTVKVYAL